MDMKLFYFKGENRIFKWGNEVADQTGLDYEKGYQRVLTRCKELEAQQKFDKLRVNKVIEDYDKWKRENFALVDKLKETIKVLAELI